MKKSRKMLVGVLAVVLMAGGAQADELLLYQFDDPNPEASVPAGFDIDVNSFTSGDGLAGDVYVSTFAGNSTTVIGTNAASLFSASDPIKSIHVMVKIDPSAFDESGNFDTPWNEMQLARFDGASGGGGHGGLILNTDNGTNQATLQSSFNWAIGGAAESDPLSWQADTWYHLGWEFRNSDQADPGVKFYRDGALENYVASGLDWSASGDIFWGNHPAAGVDAGLQGVMDNFTVTNAAIPEPATMMMLGLGGLALLRRKRN